MKQQISSAKASKALGPYSAGVATEGLVFLSGQLDSRIIQTEFRMAAGRD